jgi:glycosyltransferase involved in cell wall biosynthesis
MVSRPLSHTIGGSSRLHVGIVGTYPPRVCGLATFAAALGASLERAGHRVDVVRLQDGTDLAPVEPPVIGEIVNGDAASVARGAELLSQCDAVIVQHEYGIYGGADGEEVLDLVRALHVPVVTVLHTVPLRPTLRQRAILETLCSASDRVVVMSAAAQTRLVGSYTVDRASIVVIPHGATAPLDPIVRAVVPLREVIGDRRSPQLLTWGLLGPGKGIEHVIDALALLGDMHPAPRYTVAGVTHPKVLAQFGDRYRRSLIMRCESAGLADAVEFDSTYRDVPSLTRFVASSSVVVLPYDSTDQVTSGVLVDALAAGRPVIATAFPHAAELLSSGAGIVVPHRDPQALADAIRSVIEDPGLLASMSAEARRLAPTLSWGTVSGQYVAQIERVLQSRERIAI